MMTEMAWALLELYPAMALDQYEGQEYYGEEIEFSVIVILSGLHTSNCCWPTRVEKLKLVCVNDTTTCWQTVGDK